MTVAVGAVRNDVVVDERAAPVGQAPAMVAGWLFGGCTVAER